ncbi:ABC transporter permease subunit [bacterium]|nr:MAG: ABC transporter permease subunit [bacterium]
MPLVGKVGRRRPRARLAMALVYLLLTLGALTTLGPFLLMASTGLKGPTDQNDNRLIPSYLQDDEELLAKYVDDKYAGDRPSIAARMDIPGDVERYNRFLLSLPPERWRAGFQMPADGVTSRLRARYQEWLRARYGDIDALNFAYGEEALDFGTVDPPAELLERKAWSPPDTRKYREWLEFKRTLPAEFRIPLTTRRLFQIWAAGKWRNRIEAVPSPLRGSATSFESLNLPNDLKAFTREALPARYSVSTESLYGAPFPEVATDKAHLRAHASEIRREFAGRNLRYVLGYVLLNGRAVWVTFAFCALAVLTQLVVNPLAAYALSRYPVRQSGAILIFLLATMAFPAEVAMIPSFLLLKDLGLLNTFAALVLPGAASGYMIFLLKGFFDSLPQELFDAGSIDGARETTLMLRVAVPLAKPVLGYQALLAFMGAYGAFLYAFLVAQDSKMWTLTVWIYQLQATAPKAVMMAAVTVAAVPTLLVFLLAQRTIMRGIVLPGER